MNVIIVAILASIGTVLGAVIVYLIRFIIQRRNAYKHRKYGWVVVSFGAVDMPRIVASGEDTLEVIRRMPKQGGDWIMYTTLQSKGGK